ncbi:MAG: hypothetical protein EB140_12090, partial [Proteobacteria bacterium]|nr:hypothetical protein [Pseudomonadota bacterium]
PGGECVGDAHAAGQRWSVTGGWQSALVTTRSSLHPLIRSVPPMRRVHICRARERCGIRRTHVARQTIDGSFHEVRVLSIAITADAAARQFIGQVTDAKRPSVTKSNGRR